MECFRFTNLLVFGHFSLKVLESLIRVILQNVKMTLKNYFYILSELKQNVVDFLFNEKH